MLFRSLNKKGSTEDIVLHPLFVIGVAIGIVLLVLLQSVYKIGSSEEFEKRFVATDAALFVDSVYAVRPDVALLVEYPTGKFQGIVSANKVTAFSKTKEDGQSFFFTEDSAYTFHYGSWLAGKPLNLYKSGNDIGLGDILRLKPYCPPSTKTYDFVINEFAVRTGEDWASDRNGKPAIKGTITQGKPVLKIFTSKENEPLACQVTQSLVEQIPELNFVILPLDQKQEPTLSIELTASNPVLAQSYVYTALSRGLHDVSIS